MFTLYFIIIVNLLVAFAHELSKPLKTFLTKPSKEHVDLKNKIGRLEKELNEINMLTNYTEWVKKQRRIFSLQQQLPTPFSAHSLKKEAITFGLGYIFQIVGTIFLIGVSIFYRYTPIIVFDEKFNFSPFGQIIAFPTGIDNAISVPFWIFITNFSCRCIANLFRA